MDDMKKMDKALGLKVGLEIHQQLDTAKLFCSCPAVLRDDQPHFSVTRKLRAVAGEAGKVDIAAQVEQLRERTFIYEGYRDTTCLVELDEEPPHPLNPESLTIALQVAKLVNATIVSEIEVMRKTIVNGSVISGFQRTALIGIDGRIEGPFGTVTIPTIMLEEDAAKEISQEDNKVTYRLDRLGIPLIEIATGPDITDPQQAMDVAAYIGMLLRSTEKVKRGLGTIRQDLNVSITDGQRIEIKGAQDLKLLPLLVEYEALRQKNLLELSTTFKKILIGQITDTTSLFLSSASKVIADALHEGGIVLGIRIGKMRGYLGKELQPGRRLGTELSDYAKVHSGVGGLFHGDELPKYGITEEEVKRVREFLSCAADDNFILIVDEPMKVKRAMEAVVARLLALPNRVIKEVRRAHPDGTTSYMRPMPGSARLYPETDVRPISPHPEKVALPELWTEKAKRLQEIGLGSDLAQTIVSEGHADLLLDCIKKYQPVTSSFIAETIVSIPKILLRKYNITINPTAEDYHFLFAALAKGRITKDAIVDLFHTGLPVRNHIEEFSVLSEDELKTKIKELLVSMKDVPSKVVVGKIIGSLKLRADARRIMEILHKIQKV